MTVEVVTDEAGLAALWPAWEALWQRVPGAPPFIAPAWLRPWWAVFGTAAPVVAVLRLAGRVAGVLPLYRLGAKLLPFGVGLSDYFDALVTPEAGGDAAAILVHAALAAGNVAQCDLPELPPGAVLRGVPPPDGWHRDGWQGETCPVLPLRASSHIPRGMRRDVRQARNRAARAGGWTIRRADAGSYAGLLADLRRLHAARWQGRGEPGVLADPDVSRFHSLAGPALLVAGLLRMEAVVLRGEVAAVVYALLGDRSIHFYLSGFSADHAFESPVVLLVGQMLDEAAAEGRCEAHFLRGDEAYKYAWGAMDAFNRGVSFSR